MSNGLELQSNWDPLSETAMSEEITSATLKRQIKNIIKSYTGYFDPLSELIQNALDAVDERKRQNKDYTSKIWIEINLKDNYVCVTDNGIGFSREQFTTFLQPNVSFKGGGTRGDKGVGATYLAYGFNYLQIGTRTPQFSYVGDLEGGRQWVEDERNIVTRPRVVKSNPLHKAFDQVDRGSTFCLKFVGDHIRPRDLAWPNARNCEQWEVLLRIKTPLGGIYLDRGVPSTTCALKVIDSEGNVSEKTIEKCTYIYPHTVISTCVDVRKIMEAESQLAKKGKRTSRLPSHFQDLNGIYCYWNLGDETKTKEESLLSLDGNLRGLLLKHNVTAYGFFTYSTDIWNKYNDSVVGLRQGMRILKGGLQMATNGMPQGELILIPLLRNIGHQHVCHVIVHFSLADPDLGRKGFQPELEDLAKTIAVSIVEFFEGWKTQLKKKTGAPPQILQDKEIHAWKKETEEYEKKSPLLIKRKDVFLPTKEVSLTAAPQVEQDVVSLFNQLLAGGVIRGIKLMSASQHRKYDGLWKGYQKEPLEHYLYHKENNPLGVQTATPTVFESPPYVLEYKCSFDALLEEIEEGDKEESAIDLVVCWEMGRSWKKRYRITSLLHFSNLHHRDVHGITHLVQDSITGQYVFRVIVLKELIDYINDPDGVQNFQEKTYMTE